MDLSPRSRLTALQGDLLRAFFAHEQRFFLTGGGALVGFYFGHRETEDIDLFSPPGLDLEDAARSLDAAASASGATVRMLQTYPTFRRAIAERPGETCVVDLVIDRAPMVEPTKAMFGEIRVDTLREITANKICTLLGRGEIKDLVDLHVLIGAGNDLELALADAETKDTGADPATLAWLLSELTIGTEAILPGGVAPNTLIEFRDELIPKLRALAFRRVRRDP